MYLDPELDKAARTSLAQYRTRTGGGRKEQRMGYLYKQKSRDGTPGRIWWAKYYVNGRPVRESTGTNKEMEARRFLKAQEGHVATGQSILPRADRIRYEEVARDLRGYYAATGSRDVAEAEFRLAHLDRHFAGWRIAGIGAVEVNAYVVARQRAGAANGTINRELATLTARGEGGGLHQVSTTVG